MSSYLSMINQKLLFARLLVKELDQGGENPHRQKALVESVVFQLRLAYHFHLQEIAANYQCRQPALVADIAALSQQLTDINKWPSEAQEMQSLLDTRSSWLAGLLRGYSNCFEAGEAQSRQDSAPSTESISLRQLPDTPESTELEPDRVVLWLQALAEMIERHREGMFEC